MNVLAIWPDPPTQPHPAGWSCRNRTVATHVRSVPTTRDPASRRQVRGQNDRVIDTSVPLPVPPGKPGNMRGFLVRRLSRISSGRRPGEDDPDVGTVRLLGLQGIGQDAHGVGNVLRVAREVLATRGDCRAATWKYETLPIGPTEGQGHRPREPNKKPNRTAGSRPVR